MKQGKHERKKFKIIEKYSVLMFIAALFMCVGYAEITDVELVVEGTADTIIQEGVFITDVVNMSNADGTENSKINYFRGTMLDSEIILENISTATQTYKIILYNNSAEEQLFIGVITDEYDDTLYSNENIDFYLNGVEEYVTTISPNKSLEFTITFKYVDGTNISNSTLKSKLNFRFKEIPTIALSNENETYTLNDIYPDYISQKYEFSVSNYDKTKTNIVPMKYYLETTIESPLTAKIYDENGKEIIDEIDMGGNGEDQIDHTYTLEIIWDNSYGEGYNNVKYADKEFKCNVLLNAVPVDEKYMNYSIKKEFNVDINTASFSFNAKTSATNLSIKNNLANLTLDVNNYTSDTVYNKFDTSYEISIHDNTNFTFSANGENSVNNIITKTLSGGSKQENSLDIQLAADMSGLNVTEKLTLKIIANSAYSNIDVIEIPITITLHTVNVTLNPKGGSVSQTSMTVYQYKTYENLPTPTWAGHDFNGWYTAETGGEKISNGDIVTTDSPTQVLYAQWTTRLLVDKVSMGDYISYPVDYTNVPTNINNGTYAAASTYVGWRVLDVQGSGDNRYVRIIPAGVPITYRHIASTTATATTSVSNLTNNFFGIPFSTSTSSYAFYSSGFKTSTGGTVNTQSALQSLFTNDYTQISSGVPAVRSLTVNDIETVLNIETSNEMSIKGYNNLFAVPSSNPSTGYAGYYLAEANGVYLWAVYREGVIVYTYAVQGVRPVVSLKVGLETSGQVDGVWQLP